MIGVGFDGAVDDVVLAEVERGFAARGARLQAEVATLADPALPGRLVARGYVASGFENVLGHPLTNIPPLPDGVVVEPLGDGDRGTFVDVLVEAWAHPDAGGVGGDAIPPTEEIRRWLHTTMRVPGFRGYIARMGDAIAGGASLRLDAGVAQFSGAATRPGFRRRGVQTALIRARLADAARHGCDVGVVTTQPASQSQQNVQREGFALLYARQLLAKQPTT
jgi:GNAT superfamily N-acetyltransferase